MRELVSKLAVKSEEAYTHNSARRFCRRSDGSIASFSVDILDVAS